MIYPIKYVSVQNQRLYLTNNHYMTLKRYCCDINKLYQNELWTGDTLVLLFQCHDDGPQVNNNFTTSVNHICLTPKLQSLQTTGL